MPIGPADQKETILLPPLPCPSSANPPPKRDRLERGQSLPHQHSAATAAARGGWRQRAGRRQGTALPYTCPLQPWLHPLHGMLKLLAQSMDHRWPRGAQDTGDTRGSEFACQLLPAAAFRAWKRKGGGWMHRSAELYESSPQL